MKKWKLRIIKTYHFIDNFNNIIKKACVPAYSGQTAFFMMLSFFPLIMFIFSILKYTPFTKDVFMNLVVIFIPQSFHSVFDILINNIYDSQPATLVPATVITALWLGSKAFLSLSQGLNSAYHIKETRNFIYIRLWSAIYTVVFVALILSTLAVLVFGNTLYYYICGYFPILKGILGSIISIRHIAGFGFMFLFFMIMYHFIPNKKNEPHHKLSSQIPGSLLATAGWLVFSYIYSYYVDHFSNYSTFYGTMAMIALMMVWLYFCMYILFLGGVINYCLNKPKK